MTDNKVILISQTLIYNLTFLIPYVSVLYVYRFEINAEKDETIPCREPTN